jgi:death on curing protein
VARPQTTVYGEDAYPDLVTKAAALLQSVVNNHTLVDGNKRLGWLAAAVFLELNGIRASRATNDGVYALVMHVAAGAPTVEQIAGELRRII